jgi:methylaspartate ammonia-lyase
MSQPATITNAFIMPGVSFTESQRSLQIGLVIDDRQIVWGRCTFNSAESEIDSRLQDGSQILQEIIIPSLIGQPLTNIPVLMGQLDQMRRNVTLVMPVSDETPPQRRSRRELFTSIINPADEISEVVERPLEAELRFGVSQALLSAAALVQDVSIVQYATDLYGLTPARTPPFIHLQFDDLPNPTDLALSRFSAASYGLSVNEYNLLKELGKDGIRLQNRVRQLKNRVVSAADRSDNPNLQETAFLFDLKGGFGELFEEQTGSIFGALFGLEQVIKPNHLRLVDPVLLDDRQGHIELMKTIQNFLRIRKMKTSLIARAWIETAEDIQAFAENDCCSGVLLEMPDLGTLDRTIQLALAARESGLEVILGGVIGEAAVHTALALNPTLLAVNVSDVSAVADEINRTLAWQAYGK